MTANKKLVEKLTNVLAREYDPYAFATTKDSPTNRGGQTQDMATRRKVALEKGRQFAEAVVDNLPTTKAPKTNAPDELTLQVGERASMFGGTGLAVHFSSAWRRDAALKLFEDKVVAAGEKSE